MNCAQALEIVVPRTKNERFRALCDPSNPHHEEWCRRVIAMAAGQDINQGMKTVVVAGEAGAVHAMTVEQAAEYPSFLRQAGNLLGAAGRAAAALAKGKAVLVPREVYEARLEICKPCENYDTSSAIPVPRCKLCGCTTAGKLRGATEECPYRDPDGKLAPKWGKWEPPAATPT